MPEAFDLRSDTVTRPTEAMRRAMMQAPVGDDVFGEDPTIQRLEERMADSFGMEAGLFCPSGTMCNQIALRVHTRPMDEIICHPLSHIYLYENGGFAHHAGCSIRFADGPHGVMDVEALRAAIQPQADWLPDTRLVVAENTCNKGGGTVYPLETLQAVSAVARDHDLRLHLDGARLFNAFASGGYEATDLHGLFDTISICLSKGLGAPVGSILVGDRQTVARARKVRKAMGGGMRQAGMLAAAGLYALDHHVDRLTDDHDLATRIADVLRRDTRVTDLIEPSTNIVIGQCTDAAARDELLHAWLEAGVRAVPFGERAFRLVTHLDVTPHGDAVIDRLQTA